MISFSELLIEDKGGKNLHLEHLEDEILEGITHELVDKYVYIRDRTDFFETDSFKFVDKVQLNDWYAHVSKKKLSDKLLKDPRLSLKGPEGNTNPLPID